MDETSRAIIDKITVRYAKPTVIESGHSCAVFYDCLKLSPADLARLAAEATGDLPEETFDLAVGIAYTGILFASALAGGRGVAIFTTDAKVFGPPLKGKRVIIVDDVVHSGSKLLNAQKVIARAGATVVGFACIIDRSGGQFGSEALPLWSALQTSME